MNAQQLKNSILQEAIEGRLVSQDPNDEPASVLLEKIRKEKVRLVKEGKLKKKDLEEIPVSEDEIPFKIPESWEWVKLGNLVDFSKSNSVKSESISKTDWILDLEDIEKDSGKLLRKKTMQESDAKSDKHIFYQGNVLYSKLRPYLNKVIIADENGYCTSEILAFDFGLIYNKYAQFYLMSPFFVTYAMSDAYGVKMPRLGSKQGNAALFPLPPLKEQHRIVSKIEELMPKVEEYRKAQEALDKLNEELPERLKKSILQEAIEGRLVPQDPNDEPASVLLDKIRKEKIKLVKEGKLKKKDLDETPIDEDEIPFKLPESWEWVRLKAIATKIVDGDHNPPRGLLYDTGYYMLSSKNINNNSVESLSDVRCISFEDWKKCNERTQLSKGDVLLTTVATLGRSCVYENDVQYCFQRSVSIISTMILNYYLKFCFDSPFYQSQIEDKATGTAQRGFYLNQLEDSVIPLPPLAEQKRIVAKIEQLMNEIEKLKV